MKVLRRFLHVLWLSPLGLIALLSVLGAFSRMERTPLPNGLELGLRYIWDERFDIYLWTKDGELVAPYVLDLLCYNDHYIDASTVDGPIFFMYDIRNDILTPSSDPRYYQLSREINLTCSPNNTTGYTQFRVGAGLIVHYPERVQGCTLSNPCPF